MTTPSDPYRRDPRARAVPAAAAVLCAAARSAVLLALVVEPVAFASETEESGQGFGIY
jgi:hypothetical protein